MFRLQVLQQQMVGGENADNSEIKERHNRRKMHAEDERKKQLVRKWPDIFSCYSCYIKHDCYSSDLEAEDMFLRCFKSDTIFFQFFGLQRVVNDQGPDLCHCVSV